MEIILNDLMLSFSTALDFVEGSLVGATSGHSKRVAALSSMLGRSFGLDDEERFFLTTAAALHDNALTEFISEELRPSLTEEKDVNGYVETNLGRHCVMGERNISMLFSYEKMKDAILYHHEQADGKGPFKKKPDEIPVLARMIHFADICDVNFRFGEMSPEKYQKIDTFLDGKGKQLFDEEMIVAFRNIPYEELERCNWDEELNSIPPVKKEFGSAEIDGLCRFFAKIIDYKSPFTCTHSMGIAQKAKSMSAMYGWDEETQEQMYLAGALHDVGKLMVDNEILHKPGKLTDKEYEDIQDHAMGTYEILRKIKGFERITDIAAFHHEKLDGSGYPFKKTAEELDFQERLLMILDIYQALTEPRPYKDGMSHGKSMSIIYTMVEKGQLDREIAEDVDRYFAEHPNEISNGFQNSQDGLLNNRQDGAKKLSDKECKKILVVLTGGTIGSRIGEDAINVNPEAAYQLISMYQKKYGEDVQFEVVQPLNVLSENMTPLQWGKLIHALDEVDYASYEGVVITHGSDTLAYTSALIGMRYGQMGVPIGIIAANYALEDSRSNGLYNFRGAVSFIKNVSLPGVYTFYQDNKRNVQVYLATRVVEADCYADQFSAFGGEPYGVMKDGQFVPNKTLYNPTADLIRAETRPASAKLSPVHFTENIMLLRSYPGLNYDYISLEHGGRKPKAVLISLYHSATTCVSEDGYGAYSLVNFAKRCKAEGIAVYGSSFKSQDMKFYASINTFLEAGVTPLCNISTEAAYAKLMLAYNLNEPEAFMKENHFFEELPTEI